MTMKLFREFGQNHWPLIVDSSGARLSVVAGHKAAADQINELVYKIEAFLYEIEVRVPSELKGKYEHDIAILEESRNAEIKLTTMAAASSLGLKRAKEAVVGLSGERVVASRNLEQLLVFYRDFCSELTKKLHGIEKLSLVEASELKGITDGIAAMTAMLTPNNKRGKEAVSDLIKIARSAINPSSELRQEFARLIRSISPTLLVKCRMALQREIDKAGNVG